MRNLLIVLFALLSVNAMAGVRYNCYYQMMDENGELGKKKLIGTVTRTKGIPSEDPVFLSSPDQSKYISGHGFQFSYVVYAFYTKEAGTNRSLLELRLVKQGYASEFGAQAETSWGSPLLRLHAPALLGKHDSWDVFTCHKQ